MKKKVGKILLLIGFIVMVIVAIFNIYKWIMCGKQDIMINTSKQAYANSDLYVSITARKNGEDLQTKTKLKLVNSDGKKVKNAQVTYDGDNAIISIPQVEAGNYFIEANVSSKAGADTVKQQIYISNGNQENVTISLDKGIYKPGDTVNFRALLTSIDNDEPVEKEVNICIYDGNDNKVYNENVTTSDYGIVSGFFTLANEVNSGIYKLAVKTNTTETIKAFKVNPYITPKYEVKIDFDKQNYLVGDTAVINLSSNYFFGEAVSNVKYTVYINDKEYQTITADTQGNAKVVYKIEDAKKYTVKVEAVDSSNYFVEEISSFVAGTDIFEMEVLPEYGNLIAGQTNDVYVLTKTSAGEPLKTYITVSSGNYTKQIVTDENGIGKFSISIGSNETARILKISAKNMNGENVDQNISLKVETKNLLLSTDKAKYDQGEDIKINVSQSLDNTKNIYFFKNDKLVKMLTTESSETSVNLGDVYGLIDVYVTDTKIVNILWGTTFSNTNSYKRTIFIKPTKELNIEVSTDKQEYLPGENIKISFGTTDENSSSVDAALLVSMLDNSILSLADNDLSIDNIKMALSNVTFSNELDAAILYSCIINDSSEQSMMALLLKQGDKNINVSETVIRNTEEERNACIISIILIMVILAILISYLCVRFPKFRNVMKHIANIIVITMAVVITTVVIIEEHFWRYKYSWWMFAITAIICLASYLSWICKLNKKIYKTSISIIISYILFVGIMVVARAFNISVIPFIITVIVIIALLWLILSIISRISENKKLKHANLIEKILNEMIYVYKFVAVGIICVFASFLIANIINSGVAIIPISVLGIYFLNYLWNKSDANESKKKRRIGLYILNVLAGVGALAIFGFIAFVLGVARNFGSDFDSDLPPMSVPNYGTSGSIQSSGSGNMSSIFEDLMPQINSKPESSITTPTVDTNNTAETVVDNNIRNIFLESMCFIPEIVTANGTASVDLTLSDNITTWTIQTIGNTKDGRIGYGSLDNVKVFKEFFVDFELPKNLVETDKVSIPVTVYNYTDNLANVILNIKEEEWFTAQNNNINVSVGAQSSKMVYVPITVLKAGDHKFRVDAGTDIVEKVAAVSPKGYKVEKVVSTGNLEKDISEDILVLEDIIENTASAKVKIYASTMAQTIEGMENIFRMPTGCFEQISSSLYPNILALKYLEDNGIANEKLKTKALNYISSGYQKLLTYEVKGESGGFSLYGRSPAETVLTAYGLMEVTDLKEVYNVDESVIQKMTNFLYGKQNLDGSFTITGNYIGGANSRDKLALNAYITWALSESNPRHEKITKSIEYLKNKLDSVDDNYTLALIANALANVGDKEAANVVKRLVNNINLEENKAYITSNVYDYYGSRSSAQTIQTVALTSMALSKTSSNTSTNKLLINYLIGKKDTRGTWYSTQATILALKALNELNEKNKLENQTITVKVNSEEQKIVIKDNPLEYYQLTFNNLGKENKLNIDIEKGSAYYEVAQEYYVPYENVDKSSDIEIAVQTNSYLKVNDILKAEIRITNKSQEAIYNGMVTISIPQGFTVVEDSLMLLQTKGIIEKYEMSYTDVNIYLRNFEVNQIIDLIVNFRASYPVEITGLAIRAYDYYNPEIEGKAMPIEIRVNE